ncbi:MAG TPA: arginine--tRNA ligase [Nevskiales bacterium]|nr:arginine--tRNA ligase [Nevskiales bacterium]
MKAHLQDLLRQALAALANDALAGVPLPDEIAIERTRDGRNGDFASNLALQLAKPAGQKPRALAEAIVARLPASPQVAKVEIAGPGFINFFLAAGASQAVVGDILRQGEAYGRSRIGQGRKLLVEFVSANPTGPMHVGHGRGAAYGDSVANLLAAIGYDVTREYYINDAGRQADILALSVWIRYLELCGETLPFPRRGYPGDYIRASAQTLKARHGDAFHHPASAVMHALPAEPVAPEEASDAHKEALKAQQEAHADALISRMKQLLGPGYRQLQDHALAEQLAAIRATLDAFGVHFDRWSSERALVASGRAQQAIARLRAAGHVYEKDGAQWLRTTEFGDEKDRVLIKADGSATYFCNDIAYHMDKLDRLGDVQAAQLLDVWGADHHGYIARVRAALEALTGRTDVLEVQLIQFVTLSSGRMGKRSGNFVTFNDLVAEAGKDATRFFYLLRGNDQHLEFDIELARSKTNENPVFYVQYAHARICSVEKQLREKGFVYDETAARAALERLTEPHEQALLTRLARYPEVVQQAAQQYAPHSLVHYLRDLAEDFHSYYNAHQFLVDDAPLRNARLALIWATRTVLRNALGLLGVSAPASM